MKETKFIEMVAITRKLRQWNKKLSKKWLNPKKCWETLKLENIASQFKNYRKKWKTKQ